MSNIPVKKSEAESMASDDPLNSDFYCEKCYDMLNYFIDECQTLAPRVTKLQSNYSICKKNKDYYKNTLEAIEFNFEEMKAQKEDYEEKYNILMKSLAKRSPVSAVDQSTPDSSPLPSAENAIEPVFVNELKRKLNEKLEKLDKSLDKEAEAEAESGQLEKYESVEVLNTITLDLNYLKRQFFSETKINSQKILEYFGRKILETKETDYKRHLEVKYLPSSKKKCTEHDIELRKEINDLQVQLKEAKTENEKLKKSAPTKQSKFQTFAILIK